VRRYDARNRYKKDFFLETMSRTAYHPKIMTTQNTTPQYFQECRDALATEQAASLSATDNWSHVDKNKVHQDWDVLYKELSPLIQDSDPTSPEVQSLIERHYKILSRFYTPSKQAYIGISLFYEENEDMRNFHNAYHPAMVSFLGIAIQHYSHQYL
jgi:hypothetical protein